MHPEEAAFQDALDVNPEDWTTRLVFADWLEERGDPRGPGYRALGVRRKFPIHSGGWGYWNTGYYESRYPDLGDYVESPNHLPGDWYAAMENGWEVFSVDHEKNESVPMRQMAEDRAAIAFAKLPPERQAELLSVPCPSGEDR